MLIIFICTMYKRAEDNVIINYNCSVRSLPLLLRLFRDNFRLIIEDPFTIVYGIATCRGGIEHVVFTRTIGNILGSFFTPTRGRLTQL